MGEGKGNEGALKGRGVEGFEMGMGKGWWADRTRDQEDNYPGYIFQIANSLVILRYSSMPQRRCEMSYTP